MKKPVSNLTKRIAMAATNQAAVARTLAHAYVRLEWFLARANPPLFSRILGTQRVGARVPVAVNPYIESMLREIPSEATLRERRFLYHFFSNTWSGQNSVIEVGPFLGGTTRAIALGMCDNPRAAPDAKLLTFDRFSGYYDLPLLVKSLQPLLERGVLKKSDFEALGNRVEFLPLFKKIHGLHDYNMRIVPQDAPLPDKPGQGGAHRFSLPANVQSDAVFVDGCKSWFATKFFMREISKAVHAGAYFIFQDYGHYTCFWIAAFLALFRDHFRLVAYVDDTYTFVLTKRLIAEEIDQRYPDEPAGFSEERFIELFDGLAEEAKTRDDYFAVARHAMHKAAALAYLGNKRAARAILADLADQTWTVSQRTVIKQALSSPTYTPDGQIFLD